MRRERVRLVSDSQLSASCNCHRFFIVDLLVVVIIVVVVVVYVVAKKCSDFGLAIDIEAGGNIVLAIVQVVARV